MPSLKKLHASADEKRSTANRKAFLQRRGSGNLSRMLANRPSRNRMVAMNIIKEDNGPEKKDTMNSLNKALANRPDQASLVKTNILKGGLSSKQHNAIQRARLELEKTMARDKLSRSLVMRPARSRLVKMGVLSENKVNILQRRDSLKGLFGNRLALDDIKARGIYKPAVLSEEESEFAQSRKDLGNLLSNRSSIDSIKQRGIYQDQAVDIKAEAKARKLTSKANLGNLLARRSGMEELQRRNIIKQLDATPQDAKATLNAFFAQRPARSELVNHRMLADIGQVSNSAEADDDCLEFTKVSALSVAATELNLGHGHSMLLTDSGVVYTMGCGGEGGGTDPLGPLDLSEYKISAVTHIACGIDHSVIIADGKAYSWGAGNWGRLGLGHQLSVDSPQPIDLGEETVVSASCGTYHTLLLTASNKVFGFGWNKNGRVGPSEQQIIGSPMEINIPTSCKIVQLAAGSASSMAVDDMGNVYTWGEGYSGVLGHGDKKNRNSPTLVQALTSEFVTMVAVGCSHAIALTKSNKVLCWGRNSSGQLGCGNTTDVLTPTVIDFDGKEVTSFCCGRNHSAFVRAEALFTCGNGEHGILGLGQEDNKSVPTAVKLPTGVTAKVVALGWNHSAFIAGDGSVYTCGRRQHGQLGH